MIGAGGSLAGKVVKARKTRETKVSRYIISYICANIDEPRAQNNNEDEKRIPKYEPMNEDFKLDTLPTLHRLGRPGFTWNNIVTAKVFDFVR